MPPSDDTTQNIPAQTEDSPFKEPELEGAKSSLDNESPFEEPKLDASLRRGGQGEETRQDD
jgi:hypothetical protein